MTPDTVSVYNGNSRNDCEGFMRVLSFETATYFGGVGYLAPGVRDCAGPFAPRAASSEVMAAAEMLLDRNGCAFEELDLIAVSTGPGLFTGVRVGLSIAKTLAWAQGGNRRLALVPVPTLDAVAVLGARMIEHSPETPIPLVAVTDARRGEVYAALFACRDAQTPPERLTEDLVTRPEQVLERLLDLLPDRGASIRERGRIVWIGDGAEKYSEILGTPFEGQSVVLPRGDANLALCVAELGVERFKSGDRAEAEAVRPHYVRRPDARLPVVQSYLSPGLGQE
jgi:tRNA threonylcarbamoyladenosine biosynthesis protein TsaB